MFKPDTLYLLSDNVLKELLVMNDSSKTKTGYLAIKPFYNFLQGAQ